MPTLPRVAHAGDNGALPTKLRHVARVIDDLGADVLAIEEMENEAVVRDLVATLHTDYNYIHRTTSDRRGADVALLYRGGCFFPLQVSQAVGRAFPREVLVVRGVLRCDTVSFLVCHLPSKSNRVDYRRTAVVSLSALIDSVMQRHPREALIVLGDFNAAPDDLVMRPLRITSSDSSMGVLHTPFRHLSREGYGTLVYRDHRSLFDYILLGEPRDADCWRGSAQFGIFARDYMVQTAGRWRGYPLRTFLDGRYTGGYSDHLPVYWVLERATR